MDDNLSAQKMSSGEESEKESFSDDSYQSDAGLNELFFPAIDTGEPSTSEVDETAFQVMEGQLSIREFANSKPKIKYNDPVYRSLIGQANFSLAHRNFKEALLLCERAVRLGPYDPSPYQIMSEIYEEIEEHVKALKLGMIAAFLGNQDAETWVALGEKAVDMELTSDALFCYQSAGKINPNLLKVYEALLKLYNPETEKKLVLGIYQKIVQKVPAEAGQNLLRHARTGAGMLLAENDVVGALTLMETAFQKVSSSVTFDDVNLIAELYISLQKFRETLQIISKYCDVVIEAEEDLLADDTTSEVTNSCLRITSCQINGEIPIQLRTKLIIALIRLKALHLVDNILSPILPLVEDYGDVLIDIVEVFIAETRYEDAIKILKLLVHSKNFNLAQVWLHYAECLKNVNRKEEAVSAYLVVMDLAPQLSEARLVVSALLNDLGRSEEAISALTQDLDSEFLDIGLLYERCSLLKCSRKREDEFLAAGRLLLSRHCARFRTRQEFCSFMRFSRFRKSTRKEEKDPGKQPTPQDEFELLVAMCNVAFESKQFALLQRLACSALSSKIIMNPTNEKETFSLAALSAYFNRDSMAGHAILKNLIYIGVDNNRIWNVFNQLVMETGEAPQQKYIMRLLNKFPFHSALPTIFANHCFISGTYKQALSEYLLQFKNQPHPLQALLIATTFMQIALQKHSTGVNALVAQAMGFISEYQQLRSKTALQETYYNLGRITHQMNLLPSAIHYYKLVLETPAPVEAFDLKREAAYNLSLLYRASNSFDLARYYIQKYIVIE